MYKKILGLLLIMAISLALGCTSKDQGSGVAQPTASPLPSQPAISPVPTDTGASNVTINNESMPELDLPLPPDLSDI